MEPKFIETEVLLSLYFYSSQKRSVGVCRFFRYTSYLQRNVGNKWDLTCDKYDLMHVDEEYPNIFSFSGSNLRCKTSKSELREKFFEDTPKEFLGKAMIMTTEFFKNHPEFPISKALKNERIL